MKYGISRPTVEVVRWMALASNSEGRRRGLVGAGGVDEEDMLEGREVDWVKVGYWSRYLLGEEGGAEGKTAGGGILRIARERDGLRRRQVEAGTVNDFVMGKGRRVRNNVARGAREGHARRPCQVKQRDGFLKQENERVGQASTFKIQLPGLDVMLEARRPTISDKVARGAAGDR